MAKETSSFENDTEKMIDFWNLSKDEFLASYSYLSEAEYDATAEKVHKLADFSVRPIKQVEQKYTFAQSQQISMQTGLIGYLRADMDSSGKGFFSSWNDFRSDLKTDEFKEEFDNVINSLRKKGNFFSNRDTLNRFCNSTPEGRYWDSADHYGVRVDTEKYSYLMRLNPKKGEYNLYCYCYKQDWLNDHLLQAENGIRFIDSQYNEQFRIPDGDEVRVTYGDGAAENRTCRYIDDYHFEIGSELYHICQFAELLEKSGGSVIPMRSSLPDFCYTYIESENKVGVIRKGFTGYFECTKAYTGKPSEVRSMAEELNRKAGITKAQAEAMKCGSLFGWNVKGADPKNYDQNGCLIKPKGKNKDYER